MPKVSQVLPVRRSLIMARQDILHDIHIDFAGTIWHPIDVAAVELIDVKSRFGLSQNCQQLPQSFGHFIVIIHEQQVIDNGGSALDTSLNINNALTGNFVNPQDGFLSARHILNYDFYSRH